MIRQSQLELMDRLRIAGLGGFLTTKSMSCIASTGIEASVRSQHCLFEAGKRVARQLSGVERSVLLLPKHVLRLEINTKQDL